MEDLLWPASWCFGEDFLFTFPYKIERALGLSHRSEVLNTVGTDVEMFEDDAPQAAAQSILNESEGFFGGQVSFGGPICCHRCLPSSRVLGLLQVVSHPDSVSCFDRAPHQGTDVQARQRAALPRRSGSPFSRLL